MHTTGLENPVYRDRRDIHVPYSQGKHGSPRIAFTSYTHLILLIKTDTMYVIKSKEEIFIMLDEFISEISTLKEKANSLRGYL